MKRIILLLFLLTALVAAPVAASQTESDAIDTTVLAWYAADRDDYDTQVDLELALAEMELTATSPECSAYAGWHLVGIAIFNEWEFTDSPYLADIYSGILSSTPQAQYACLIAP